MFFFLKHGVLIAPLRKYKCCIENVVYKTSVSGYANAVM